MNEDNFEYLTKQLRSTGFGDRLNDDLRKAILSGKTEFQLTENRKYDEQQTTATLHFKKSEKSDLIFFNKYELALKDKDGNTAIRQSFPNKKQDTFTVKEGFNLLTGGAVHKTLTHDKTGEKYNAWLEMDFHKKTQTGNFKIHQYHQNYGYHVDKIAGKYNIKDWNNPDYQDKLVASLKKGNQPEVTLIGKDGDEMKVRVAANPKERSLVVKESAFAVDGKGKLVEIETLIDRQMIDKKLGQQLLGAKKKLGAEQSQQQKAGNNMKVGGDDVDQKPRHRIRVGM
jgi:hypothetical protein